MPYEVGTKKKKFKFSKRRKITNPAIIRSKPTKDIENLTGFVRGFRASDIEERFANALRVLGIGYWFQYEVKTELSLPDQDRRVDFIVFYSPVLIYPIEIYGERWHASAGDQNRDRARRIEIDDRGRQFSPPWQPVEVIWGRELATQNMALAKARSIFG